VCPSALTAVARPAKWVGTCCSNPYPREGVVFLQIMIDGDHTGAPGGPGTTYFVTVAGPIPVADSEIWSVRSPHVIYVDSWTRLVQLAPTLPIASAPAPHSPTAGCTDAQ